MFPNSLPQVENKYFKNVQTENIKNLCHLFPLVIFKREIVMDVYRTEVTFFYSNGRDGLLFIIILSCIFGYCALFRFQNQQ